jgi:hypothetical protein
VGFYFSDFSPNIAWKAIAVANMSGDPASVTLHAVGGGRLLGSAALALGANDKRVGHYTTWFPEIDFHQIERIIAVSSAAGLCGVTISGNADSSRLLFTPAAPAPGFSPGGFTGPII